MKKLKLIIITVLLIFVVSFIAVVIAEALDPRDYYIPCALVSPNTEDISEESYSDDFLLAKSIEPSKDVLNKMHEIYNNLCDYYKLNKDEPRYRIISKKDLAKYYGSSSMEIHGLYSYKYQTIFVSDDFSTNSIPVIAHEMLHYLSDNNDAMLGCKYEYQGKCFGYSLSEGLTNYFSSKVYPYPESSCVYEYETHIASLLAEAFGEEKLLSCYISSDITALKNDFNTTLSEIYTDEVVYGVRLSAFDVFVDNLEYYAILLNVIEEINPQMLFNLVNSEEETLLNYCQYKGKEKEFSELTKTFLLNETLISWSYYSKIPEILSDVQQ